MAAAAADFDAWKSHPANATKVEAQRVSTAKAIFERLDNMSCRSDLEVLRILSERLWAFFAFVG